MVGDAEDNGLARNDASERNEGDCGYYYNAGCQHENFYGIKARKYWLFRHGYFLKHPTPMDKEVRSKGEIVINKRSDVRIATTASFFKTLALLAKCGKKSQDALWFLCAK